MKFKMCFRATPHTEVDLILDLFPFVETAVIPSKKIVVYIDTNDNVPAFMPHRKLWSVTPNAHVEGKTDRHSVFFPYLQP